jgi:hypothetical protein
MTDETTKLIQQLAEKLGTTADHLWAVLVRQAPISCTIDLITTIASLIAAPLLAWLATRAMQKADDGEEAQVPIAIAFGIVAVMAGLIAAVAVCSLGNTLSGFFNPEYWALKQVLK